MRRQDLRHTTEGAPPQPRHALSACPCPAPAPSPAQQFTDLEALKAAFTCYGELAHAHMPRNVNSPQYTRGFAFLQFKHSADADA